MRVTHQLIKRTVLNNVHNNLARMSGMQNMLSSGKAINRPSDNPIKAAQIMRFTTVLDGNEQYQKNIDAAKSWLNITEDALRGITEALQRVNELAVAGANGALSDAARRAIAMEVGVLTDVLVQSGNASYQGRYIFSGYQTKTAPLTRVGGVVLYHGDRGSISWEVAQSVTIRGNIDGQDLFFDSGLFAAMGQLEQGLLDGDAAAVSGSISLLDSAMDHVLNKRAAVGAMVNGLERSLENFQTEKINFTELRSRLEDIDLAETYMNYAMLENAYRASLSAGARVIQPSLLDFLR